MELSEFPFLDLVDPGGFIGAIGLRFDAATAELVTAHLEVTPDHHTPWGIVHGGLYASMIESAASVGASIAVAGEGRFAVGVSNQTDFLRPHRHGRLDVRAVPIQQGRTLQLWEVAITNSAGKLVARGQVRLFNQAQDGPVPQDGPASQGGPTSQDGQVPQASPESGGLPQ